MQRQWMFNETKRKTSEYAISLQEKYMLLLFFSHCERNKPSPHSPVFFPSNFLLISVQTHVFLLSVAQNDFSSFV